MPSDKGPLENFGKKLDAGLGNAAQKIEEEGEKVIQYLNSQVVPAIRGNSTKALRIAADKLQKLADFMERKSSQ